MNRPSKKDIRKAVQELKHKADGAHEGTPESAHPQGKLPDKKSSQRIRKQGV